jgi:hypothetical protein
MENLLIKVKKIFIFRNAVTCTIVEGHFLAVIKSSVLKMKVVISSKFNNF